MKIGDLEKKTGQSARQIRYLISEGFVPPPVGDRKAAQYGAEHVSAIEEYQKLRDLGLAPRDIKTVLHNGRGDAIVVDVAPGVALVISPSSLKDSSEDQDVATLTKNIISAVRHGARGLDSTKE